MSHTLKIFAIIAVLGLVAMGCREDVEIDDELGFDDTTAVGENVFGADTTEAAQLTIAEHDEHGEYIADGEGRALYMFEADSQGGASQCYDDCANAWPPLITDGTPETEAGVDSSLVGTVDRRDGTQQVTYNGWPLYYFVQDSGEGDVAGHDVDGFGGEWYLVTPEGEMVGHDEM